MSRPGRSSLRARSVLVAIRVAIRVAILVAVLVTTLSGCINLAPDYRRPIPVTPTLWPSVGDTSAPEGVDGLDVAELGWRQFLLDPRLQRVVAFTIAHNRDLRVAVLNIEQARAQYRDTRSVLFPSIAASSSATFSRSGRTSGQGNTASGNLLSGSDTSSSDSSIRKSLSAELGFTRYELDVFGRLRNQNQAAFETVLSLAETRRSTQISLIAEAANNWLRLAADKELLALVRDTLTNQKANLKLVRARHDYGVASGSDVANAQSTVESARVDVATYVSQVAQDRNALNRIAGGTVPATDLPGQQIPADPVIDNLPPGVPSHVLQNRPDVAAAEYTLRSDTASIGAARAAFFPTISLTASTGWATRGLSGLFAGDNRSWSFTPRLDQPIFDGGSRLARLQISRIQRDIDIAHYEQSIQTAFSEVADALATRATIDEQIAAQQALVAANRRAYRLSQARYRYGTDSYLDTLVDQRTLYTSRKNEVSRRLARQTNLVTLYKVLGGGALAPGTTAAPDADAPPASDSASE